MTTRAGGVRIGAVTAAVVAAGVVAALTGTANAAVGSTVDAANAAAAPQRVGAAPHVPTGVRTTGVPAASTPLHLTVNLAPRDPQALKSFITAVGTKGSPEYHHYLKKGQFAQFFGPTPATVASVEKALRQAGLTPGQVTPDGMSIPVTTTVGQASKALGTGFAMLRFANGSTAYQNTAAPELPHAVAGAVSGITGLTSVHLQHNHLVAGSRAAVRPGAVRSSAVTANAGGPTACSGITNSLSQSGLQDTRDYYSAQSLASAYGLEHTATSGSGVSIGVFELESVSTSDIAAYQSCYGTSTSVHYVKVDGGPATPPNTSANPPVGVESLLDIEDLIGLVPGASIVDYEGPDAATATDQQVVDTYQRMVTDDAVQVISSSWGACETLVTGSDPGMYNAENNVFMEAAAQGQTVVNSSGDAGSTGCYGAGVTADNATVTTDDPASQPYVTAVGGTKMTGLGSTLKQSVWNEGGNTTNGPGGATGGGVSSHWALDSTSGFQAGFSASGYANTCTAASGQACRQVPDVSALGDPYTGYLIAIDGGYWEIIGGTSGAAPTWAAVVAEADAENACSSAPLGDINPALYGIGKSSSSYAADLTDILPNGTANDGVANDGNSNDYTPSGYTAGDYAVTTGYDLATGLGTPKYAALASSLCAAQPAPSSSTFHTTTPTRLLDTRYGTGGVTGPVGADSTVSLQVTGHAGVPTSGATAVVLNVTAVAPTKAGFVTVYPAGHVRPISSSLNFTPGETIPNLVTVPLGENGKVSFYNHAGTVQLVADITGYYAAGTSGSLFTSMSPTRLLDTRSSSGAVGPNTSIVLPIEGAANGKVPATGVTAAVLNVTATAPTKASFVSVYPDGTTRTSASNLNFTAGETIPNLVIVPVGTDGKIDLYNHDGSVQLVVDIMGYFTTTGAQFTTTGPARIMDTRYGTGGFSSPVQPNSSIALQVAGVGKVPANATAVVLNVTATDPTSASFVSVYPDGVARSSASNLNFLAGETIPNGVVVPVGANGKIDFYNHSGTVDLIADITGYFTN